MAFIVEDGTGVKGANSYCTVQFMRDYFADRGIDLAVISDTALQAALIAATDYIDTRWGSRLLSSRFWNTLRSRSIFTLTDLPNDGETVTIDSDIFTFRTTVVAEHDVEIATTLIQCLSNLATVAASVDVQDGFFIADPDEAAMAIFTIRDGITTQTTVINGSFSTATTIGYSVHPQPLEFPRRGFGLPVKLKMATCEYANRARTIALAPDSAVDNTISSQAVAVGPISKSVVYRISSPIKAYPAADRLLQEYIRPGGIVRA